MFLFCNQQATAACSLPHLLLVIMPRRADCPGNADLRIGNATAAMLFAKSPEVEMSYFWKDKITSIECKCRPAAMLENKELKFRYKGIARLGSAVLLLLAWPVPPAAGWPSRTAWTDASASSPNTELWPSRTAWTAATSAACPVTDKIHARRIDYKPVHAAGGTASAACTVQLAWPAGSASSPNTEYRLPNIGQRPHSGGSGSTTSRIRPSSIRPATSKTARLAPSAGHWAS